jgi:septum formation protein
MTPRMNGRMSPTRRVVLASASLRRRELLEHLGIDFDVVAPDIDESVHGGEDPRAYVRRLGEEKNRAARRAATIPADHLVIAADTTVDVDGRILGKPEDAGDALAMLHSLRGRTHQVHTGMCVTVDGRSESVVVSTSVTFADVTEAELAWYVGSGEPFGKAGAYGIQGAAGAFVAAIDGSVSNVIGLPMSHLLVITRSMGVPLIG